MQTEPNWAVPCRTEPCRAESYHAMEKHHKWTHNGKPAEVPHYEAKHSRDLSEPAQTHTHLNKRTSTHTQSHPHSIPIETKRYSTQSSPSITVGDPWKTNMRLTFLSSNNHLLRQMIVSCSLDYCAARSCPHKSRRTALLSNFIDSSLAQCVHFELHSVITWLRDSTLCVWHFFFLISFYEQERI